MADSNDLELLVNEYLKLTEPDFKNLQKIADKFLLKIYQLLGFQDIIKEQLKLLKISNKSDLNNILTISRLVQNYQSRQNDKIREVYSLIVDLQTATSYFLGKINIFTFVTEKGDILFGDQSYIKELYSKYITKEGKGSQSKTTQTLLQKNENEINTELENHIAKLKNGTAFPGDGAKWAFVQSLNRLERSKTAHLPKKLLPPPTGTGYPWYYTASNRRHYLKFPINRGHLSEGYIRALFSSPSFEQLSGGGENAIKALLNHIRLDSGAQIYGGDVSISVNKSGSLSIELMVKSFNYSIAGSSQYIFLAYNILNLTEQQFQTQIKNQSLTIIKNFYKKIEELPSNQVIVDNKTLEQYLSDYLTN